MSDLLYRLGQRALGTAPRVVPLMRPGRATGNIASSQADSFGETETFRDVDQAPSRDEAALPDNSMKQRARPTAAPTLGQVIAQIFRDEAKDDDTPGAPEPASHPSMSGRNRIDPGPDVNKMRHGSHSVEEAKQSEATTPNPFSPAIQPERPTPRLMRDGLPSAHVPASAVRTTASRTEVEVSIGRIEVHTASPPVQAALAPARRTPVLTLDDYLANRRGEKA
jgi:hypothetical protein